MKIFFDFDRYVHIYHYHKIHKYFIGDDPSYFQLKGSGLPADSTEIAPPIESLTDGYIYVFNGQGWTQVEDIFVKPDYTELNYTYHSPIPDQFKINLIQNPLIYLPQFRGITDYISPFNKSYFLVKKYEFVQKKYLELEDLHQKFRTNKNSFTSGDSHQIFRFESEFFIMIMRSVIDELVQITFLLTNNIEIDKINLDSIGTLFKHEKKFPDCANIIFGNELDYIQDKTNYLKIINELFNSIKHSSIHYEAYNLYSPDTPNVVSLQKSHNDFLNNKVIYHNHSIKHLIYGFIYNFHRIIENQKIYIAERHLNLMKVVQLLYHLKSQKINNEQKQE